MKSSKYGISRIKNFNPMNQERELSQDDHSRWKKKKEILVKKFISRERTSEPSMKESKERERGK